MCTNRIITNAVLALAAAMLTGSASAQQNQAVVEFLTPMAAQAQVDPTRLNDVGVVQATRPHPTPLRAAV